MSDDASLDKARRTLITATAQWACGFVGATDVVDTATNALVAGLDSPNLRVLAGVPAAEATIEAPDLIERVMDELELPYHGPRHPTSRLLAAAALAAEHLHGRLPARDLCRIVHQHYGHQAHDLIEPLAVLDYHDTFEYSQSTEAALEQQTLDAARNLTAAADKLATTHRSSSTNSPSEAHTRHLGSREPLA